VVTISSLVVAGVGGGATCSIIGLVHGLPVRFVGLSFL